MLGMDNIGLFGRKNIFACLAVKMLLACLAVTNIGVFGSKNDRPVWPQKKIGLLGHGKYLPAVKWVFGLAAVLALINIVVWFSAWT